MPTSVDLVTRTEVLMATYGKYLQPEEKKSKETKSDAFTELKGRIEQSLEVLREKAEEVEGLTNRASIATLNAEIRRGKASLRADLPKLAKYAGKKTKGLTPEEIAARHDAVKELEEAIEMVPDGVHRSAKPKPGPTSHVEININDVEFNSDNPLFAQNMEHTEQSRGFQREFELAKERQDEGLDEIAKGVGVLKMIAGDMGDELTRQAPLIDAIDTKVETANSDLKSANANLKRMIHSLRSSRNFCMDVVLLSILLGIGAYIYNQVK